jgi:hypothetical protein
VPEQVDGTGQPLAGVETDYGLGWVTGMRGAHGGKAISGMEPRCAGLPPCVVPSRVVVDGVGSAQEPPVI